jgi:hypothetical protein
MVFPTPSIIHRQVDKTNTTIFEIAHTAFQNLRCVGFYVAALLVVGNAHFP